MQIKPGDDTNTIAASYGANGQDPVPVAHACEECGETWERDRKTEGARYFIGGRWLCVACRCK